MAISAGTAAKAVGSPVLGVVVFTVVVVVPPLVVVVVVLLLELSFGV